MNAWKNKRERNLCSSRQQSTLVRVREWKNTDNIQGGKLYER